MSNSLKRPDVGISEEQGDALTRELVIQEAFFNAPKDLSAMLKLGQNQFMCPRTPIQMHYKLGNGKYIWKTPEQVKREQQDIIGQPVPICAVGHGTLVEGFVKPLDYIMLRAQAQPERTFYIKNVKFDVYDATAICCVVNEGKKDLFNSTYKDNPPVVQKPEAKEVEMPQPVE